MDEIEQPEPTTPEQKESKSDQAVLQKETQQRLGKRLLQAREQEQLSLVEVSERLRIREAYLASLERGEWDDLPEETYVRGFLRQYADLLKLDISEELKALKPDEFHLTKPFTMPDPPIAPSRKWTIAVAAIFVLLIVFFNVLKDTHHRDVVAPQAPPPSPPLKNETGKQPAETKTTTPVTAPTSQAPQATEKRPVATASAPVETHQFRFTAVGENAWLQVFDDQHTLLKEALLKPGDNLSLDYGDKPLFVTCGNAAALEIRADGQLIAAAGSLGKSGQVLRDYKLVLPAAPK